MYFIFVSSIPFVFFCLLPIFLKAATSHGVLPGQLVFSAFVSTAEENWLRLWRGADAVLDTTVTFTSLYSVVPGVLNFIILLTERTAMRDKTPNSCGRN